MFMLMCRSCGEFTGAAKKEESLVPLKDECPDCGGKEFKNIHTEEVIQVR